MGKHRKNNHLRRIAVAVIAVGAVGVPSAAMACTDWPNGGGEQASAATARPVSTFWRGEAAWDHDWNGAGIAAPASTAPGTAAAATSPSKTATPKHRPTVAKHRHVVPKHWHAAPSGTATTAAPKPWTTKAPRPPQTVTPTTPSTPSTPATPTAPTSATPTATPSPTATASGDVARVVQLVNAERGKVGCPALTLNATLTKAAQAHSADMASHQNMSHTGSDGSDPGQRITAAGYTWRTYGENVAYGYAGPEQVMAGWMASPGHKANILNCSFKEIGVGLAEPNSYWTQDFGTAR